MDQAKAAAKQVLQRALDSIDGTPDGVFNPGEVHARVSAELARVKTLDKRVSADPMRYLLGGVIGGIIIGVGLTVVIIRYL